MSYPKYLVVCLTSITDPSHGTHALQMSEQELCKAGVRLDVIAKSFDSTTPAEHRSASLPGCRNGGFVISHHTNQDAEDNLCWKPVENLREFTTLNHCVVINANCIHLKDDEEYRHYIYFSGHLTYNNGLSKKDDRMDCECCKKFRPF